MTLPESANLIYCQSCGNEWDKTDANPAYYFATSDSPVGSMISPADIIAAGLDMIYCPKDDRGEITRAYRKPAPGVQESPFYERDSRMIGADVDRGGATDGDATSVHTPDQQ